VIIEAKWFAAHVNQEIRFSSALSVRKDPRSKLHSLIKDEIIIIIDVVCTYLLHLGHFVTFLRELESLGYEISEISFIKFV